MIASYKDLMAWQRAMELVEFCYRISGKFPGDERFGLTSQLRRSAVSVPSNIAEGHARRTRGEYLHFLGYAMGSLAELETQIILSQRLAYIGTDESDPLALANEVGRILRGLIKSLDPSP